MSKQNEIAIAVPNPTDAVTHIVLRAFYSKGGINYFTYKNEARGFYVSIRPVKREKTDTGFTVESFVLFGEGNFKVLVKDAQRDNKKTTEKIAAKLECLSKDIVERYLQGNAERAAELMRLAGAGL